MVGRELYAEIVKSGTWLYDGQVPSEVWIVRQNFEYHYEESYADEPEHLNEDGECFSVVIARDGSKIGRGPEKLSLAEAVSAAEEGAPGIIWDDHILESCMEADATPELQFLLVQSHSLDVSKRVSFDLGLPSPPSNDLHGS